METVAMDDHTLDLTCFPFQEILGEFVRRARSELESRLGPSFLQFAPDVLAEFGRELLGRLAELACAPLMQELEAFRVQSKHRDGWAQASATSSVVIQKEFAAAMSGSALLTFLAQYPRLEQQIETVVAQAVETQAEFCIRLEADRLALESAFAQGHVLGRVENVLTGLSAPHRGGRSVIGLRLTEGACLVYKPRSVGLESAYYQLVDWFNGHRALLPMRTIIIVERGAYGWMEYVETSPPATDEDRRRYALRLGQHLALIYALRGVDQRPDNIVAHGDQPALIDLETLCRPGGPEHSVVSCGVGLLPVGDLAQHAPSIREGFAQMYRFLVQRRQQLLAPNGPIEKFRDLPVRCMVRDNRLYSALYRRLREPEQLRSDTDDARAEREALYRRDDYWKGPDAIADAELHAIEQLLDVPFFYSTTTSRDLYANGRRIVDNYHAASGYDAVVRHIERLGEPDLGKQLALLGSASRATAPADAAPVAR